jgi:hypothetical protein
MGAAVRLAPEVADSVAALACWSAAPTLARIVVPSRRSRTKASSFPLVSAWTSVLAVERKSTKRPSPLNHGLELAPLPWASAELMLTSSVTPVCRSRTKTSRLRFRSSATRLDATEWKATKRPSAFAVGPPLARLALRPAAVRLTRPKAPREVGPAAARSAVRLTGARGTSEVGRGATGPLEDVGLKGCPQMRGTWAWAGEVVQAAATAAAMVMAGNTRLDIT